MEQVGTLKALWRYPVKSMAGEPVDSATLWRRGLRGDRRWVLRDEVSGELWSARNHHPIATLGARYVASPTGEESAHVDITLPDGSVVRSDAPDVSARISAAVGHRVSLQPIHDEADPAFYRRLARTEEQMLPYLVEQFGREGPHELPPLDMFPPETMEFVASPGVYYDVAPLHVLTTASLAHMAAANPGSTWDPRRFRPNLLIDTGGASGLVETGWVGRTLVIGSAKVGVSMPAVRCAFTTLAQAGLPKDVKILRTIVQQGDHCLGTYNAVAGEGALRVGDPVYLQ
jgi:uncharacterized protein YcbX